MSIAAAASMPWLNVCSVYRSRGISTRQGRGVASTEARAILARHLPGLFNIFPSLGTRPGRQMPDLLLVLWLISMKILKKDRTPRSLRTSASDTFPPRKNILRASDGRPQVNLPPGRSRCLGALGSFPRLTRRGASTASRSSRTSIRDPSPRSSSAPSRTRRTRTTTPCGARRGPWTSTVAIASSRARSTRPSRDGTSPRAAWRTPEPTKVRPTATSSSAVPFLPRVAIASAARRDRPRLVPP